MKAAITQNSRTNHLSENMKLVLNYSFVTALIFSVVFAIAKIFNLEGYTELRFVNYLLLFIIVFTALKKSYSQNGYKMEYFTGFTMSFLIAMLGQLFYSFIFFIYLQIDRDFMSYLLNQFPSQILYPELSIAIVLLVEGTSIGIVVALATMQYFKFKRGRWARQS